MPTRVICVFCGAGRAPHLDPKGHRWCTKCHHRYDLIMRGIRHEWPYLSCYPYAIGNDEVLWYTAALIGDEAFVRTALATIATQESDEIA